MDHPRHLVGYICLLLVTGILVAGVTGLPLSQTASTNDTAATLDSDRAVQSDSVAMFESPHRSLPTLSVDREEYTTAGIDVAAGAAADSAMLRGAFRRQTFDAQFDERIDSSATDLLNSTTDEIANITDEIDTRHAAVIANYSEGEISLDRVLRELVQLSSAANAQQAYAEHVLQQVTAGPDVTLPIEVRRNLLSVEVEIAALESPITEMIRDGDVESGTSVYAQASDDALVLAVPGDNFIRQVTLRNERDPEALNQFFEQDGNANSNALSRADELYENVGGFSPPPLDATAVYGIQGTTAVGVGSFTAYLDGATTNIFHEVLTVDPDTVPIAEVVNNSAGSLTIMAESSGETGPLHVSVTRDGMPVAGATLSINNQTVGTTTTDGTRWAVQPISEFDVTATHNNQTVSVTVPDES